MHPSISFSVKTIWNLKNWSQTANSRVCVGCLRCQFSDKLSPISQLLVRILVEFSAISKGTFRWSQLWVEYESFLSCQAGKSKPIPSLKGQTTRARVFSEVTFVSFFLFLARERNCTFLWCFCSEATILRAQFGKSLDLLWNVPNCFLVVHCTFLQVTLVLRVWNQCIFMIWILRRVACYEHKWCSVALWTQVV